MDKVINMWLFALLASQNNLQPMKRHQVSDQCIKWHEYNHDNVMNKSRNRRSLQQPSIVALIVKCHLFTMSILSKKVMCTEFSLSDLFKWIVSYPDLVGSGWFTFFYIVASSEATPVVRWYGKSGYFCWGKISPNVGKRFHVWVIFTTFLFSYYNKLIHVWIKISCEENFHEEGNLAKKQEKYSTRKISYLQ